MVNVLFLTISPIEWLRCFQFTKPIFFVRVYLASTSRQNLETIVEAIRHLEGDNLFSDNVEPCATESVGDPGDDDDDAGAPVPVSVEPQEAPLALTTSNKSTPDKPQHLIKVNMNQMNQYLQFHQNNQHRPGKLCCIFHSSHTRNFVFPHPLRDAEVCSSSRYTKSKSILCIEKIHVGSRYYVLFLYTNVNYLSLFQE